MAIPQHELGTPLSQTQGDLCPGPALLWVTGPENLWALFLFSLYGWENWDGLNRASYFSQSCWKKIVEIITYFSRSNETRSARLASQVTCLHVIHYIWVWNFPPDWKIFQPLEKWVEWLYTLLPHRVVVRISDPSHTCVPFSGTEEGKLRILPMLPSCHILGQHLTAGPLSQGLSSQSRAL